MRVLVVCFPESPHSQSWIELFGNEKEFDVRVFEHNFVNAELYLPQEWKKPTYVLEYPTRHTENVEIISLFPKSKYTKFFSVRLTARLPLTNWYLERVIKRWKPDIVHSLSLQTAYFTWQTLCKIRKNRPLFVVSSWGTDIYLGKNIPEQKAKIKEVLSNCDGYIADCERDIDSALKLGLAKKNLAFDSAVPGNGGLNVCESSELLPIERRNIILLPKAIETLANKTLSVLEALNMVRDKLEGFEVHLLTGFEEVRNYLAMMPEQFKKYCRVHTQLPHRDVIELMKRSRLMIAPSISDGTPNSMLEAMSVGALPLVSPLESIKEWIEDGKNGLLAHALYPDKIAQAIDRALSDDELFESAAIINRKIIKKRANRQQIKDQVINYYKTLLKKRKNGAAL